MCVCCNPSFSFLFFGSRAGRAFMIAHAPCIRVHVSPSLWNRRPSPRLNRERRRTQHCKQRDGRVQLEAEGDCPEHPPPNKPRSLAYCTYVVTYYSQRLLYVVGSSHAALWSTTTCRQHEGRGRNAKLGGRSSWQEPGALVRHLVAKYHL